MNNREVPEWLAGKVNQAILSAAKIKPVNAALCRQVGLYSSHPPIVENAPSGFSKEVYKQIQENGLPAADAVVTVYQSKKQRKLTEEEKLVLLINTCIDGIIERAAQKALSNPSADEHTKKIIFARAQKVYDRLDWDGENDTQPTYLNEDGNTLTDQAILYLYEQKHSSKKSENEIQLLEANGSISRTEARVLRAKNGIK